MNFEDKLMKRTAAERFNGKTYWDKDTLLSAFGDWTEPLNIVIPEWLDKDIQQYKTTDKDLGVADIISAVSQDGGPTNLYYYLFSGNEVLDKKHQVTFVLAFTLGNYKVEEPDMFYLKNKNTGKYLVQHKVDCTFDDSFFNDDNAVWQTKFTNKELETIETGSYIKEPVIRGIIKGVK